jgi:type II secretory pathway pseudopilin PulG
MRRTKVDKVCAHSRAQRGLILLALLLMLVLAGLGSLVGAEVWATTMQREREEQLLFVGDEYRRAITSYYQMTPTKVKVYPRSLNDLIEDDRFPIPVQHLRRLYPDPITDSADWGLVKAGEAIIGVHSLSEAPTLKKAGFSKQYKEFELAKTYDQWRFLARPSPAAITRPSRPKP